VATSGVIVPFPGHELNWEDIPNGTVVRHGDVFALDGESGVVIPGLCARCGPGSVLLLIDSNKVCTWCRYSKPQFEREARPLGG